MQLASSDVSMRFDQLLAFAPYAARRWRRLRWRSRSRFFLDPAAPLGVVRKV